MPSVNRTLMPWAPRLHPPFRPPDGPSAQTRHAAARRWHLCGASRAAQEPVENVRRDNARRFRQFPPAPQGAPTSCEIAGIPHGSSPDPPPARPADRASVFDIRILPCDSLARSTVRVVVYVFKRRKLLTDRRERLDAVIHDIQDCPERCCIGKQQALELVTYGNTCLVPGFALGFPASGVPPAPRPSALSCHESRRIRPATSRRRRIGADGSYPIRVVRRRHLHRRSRRSERDQAGSESVRPRSAAVNWRERA